MAVPLSLASSKLSGMVSPPAVAGPDSRPGVWAVVAGAYSGVGKVFDMSKSPWCLLRWRLWVEIA